MAASNTNAKTGTLDDTIARLDLLESRMTHVEESVNRAVGTLLPKVEALLSERNQGEVSSSSPSFLTPVASPSSLLELAERGDGETLFRVLADEMVDIRSSPPRNERGDTPLHVAAGGGHLKAVMALLGAGAAVDVSGHLVRTPLHCAAAHGHLQVARRLLLAGAKVDVKDADGATALTLAAGSGHTEIVVLFLQKGISIDSCNEEGEPLLVQAAKAKRWELVDLLLERGASPTKCKANEECALVYASKGGQADAVRQLLHRGAASSAKQVKWALEEAQSAAVVWAFVDVVPDQVLGAAGIEALTSAGDSGRLEPLVALLEAGVDVNSKDNHHTTALHWACESGHIACVRELLRRGADAKAKGFNTSTPLHEAAKGGHVECVLALLGAGASTAERNSNGKTPLDLAASDEVRRALNGMVF